MAEGELWPGEIKEEYAHFWFEKEYAKHFREEGYLWEPSTRPFQAWKSFVNEEGYNKIESYYSIFQCYTLYKLIEQTRINIGTKAWEPHSEGVGHRVGKLQEWANDVILDLQENERERETLAAICQIISNRYFPLTQSDQRSIRLSIPASHYNWDWDVYRFKWNAKAVLDEMGVGIEDLKAIHSRFTFEIKSGDPLEAWYDLVKFISIEQKDKLKGPALRAQTFYSMEKMLRLFYAEITGDRLYEPDESPAWAPNDFYGEGVTQNELEHLEFLTNKYHLNPRPRLILIVEGYGEYSALPKLVKELFGRSLPKLGIEIQDLSGVGNFTGKKRVDRYGALEKLIEDYHNRQTIVYVVLDNEGGVHGVRKKLVEAPSKNNPDRTITKAEYIKIWDKNI